MIKCILLSLSLLFINCGYEGMNSRALSLDKKFKKFYVINEVTSIAIDTNNIVLILKHGNFANAAYTQEYIFYKLEK